MSASLSGRVEGSLSLINMDAGRLPLGSQLVHLSDRYLLYVFTCLRLGRPGLTDNELSAMFGAGFEPEIKLDTDWWHSFLKRSRDSHVLLKHAGISLTGHMTERDLADGIRETTDSQGRILKIRYFGHLVPKLLALRRSEDCYGEFREKLALFPNVVFRLDWHKGVSDTRVCLVVCSEAEEHETSGDAWPQWGARYTVEPSFSRSTMIVGPAKLVAADGLSLYRMVSSWQTNACLVFTPSCGADIIKTICALAIGDKDLGTRFKLKCVTVVGDSVIDLRSLEPLVSESLVGHQKSQADPSPRPSPRQTKDLATAQVALYELRILPVAFTVLVNNDFFCALRHTLRDLLVIVPKRLASLKTCVRQGPRGFHRDPGLYGHLIEWVPSNRSAFRVCLGSSPDMSISSGGEGVFAANRSDSGAGDSQPSVLIAHRRGVLTSSKRGCDYDLSQAACLSPGTMRLSVPKQLHFAGCLAMLYSFELLASICKVNHGRGCLGLSLSSSLTLGEAQALMLAYLAVETSCEPGQRHMAFSTSRDSLRELRLLFSADPNVCPRCPRPPQLSEEFPMPKDLENQLSDVEGVTYECEDEALCLDKIVRGVHSSPRLSLWTGHSVLIDHESAFGRKRRAVGVTTLGLVNLKILKAAGILGERKGREQIYIHIPATKGVEPMPRWSAKKSKLCDEFYDIPIGNKAPDEDDSCFFQLNYQPCILVNPSTGGQLTTEPVSAREAAVVSDGAKGYIDLQLECLFEWFRRRYGPRLTLNEDRDGDSGHVRTWFTRTVVESRGKNAAPSAIGDGTLFPLVDIAAFPMDIERPPEPLHEYKLNLSVSQQPKSFALVRADRATSQSGAAYEVHVDEAVLLGHCARLLTSIDVGGTKAGFDVSVCLNAFYRAVHPCLPAMMPGDVALDYELVVHGGGSLPPVYAILEHVADTSRVMSLSWLRLIILTRHRAASAWASAVPDSQSRESWGRRINLVGAFLCSRDHRLGPLLARCCDPSPLKAVELLGDSKNLLPRGDEEELLLRAYEETLGPVFQFETVANVPSNVRTSIGKWRFLRLKARRVGASRQPGISVVDGYTFAHAAESPLFHILGEGPFVHCLESVALVVQCASASRTFSLTNDEFSWPEPTPIDRLLCKDRKLVLEEMFVRPGCRDPVEGYGVCESTWRNLVEANWIFKKAPAMHGRQSSWDAAIAVSRDPLQLIDGGKSATSWSADRPPARFVPDPFSESCAIILELDVARTSDPQAWRGFDILASRVLVCNLERTWSRGTCMVMNKALSSACAKVLTSSIKRITVVAAGDWYAKLESHFSRDNSENDDGVSHTYEVCSAPGLARALATRMLSGNTYEHLEIRCQRPNVYGYIQRMLVWFAGATGPFRSRTITIYSDEDCMVPWTHKLHSSLDVLCSSRTKYLVSCHKRCKKSEALDVELERSESILPVNSYGNLVLHSTEESVRLAEIRGEMGFHVTAVDWLSGETLLGSGKKVHIRCVNTLKRFCEEAGIPIGVRGPETWERVPWSSHNPDGFCSKVALLRYRWESGRYAPDLRAVCLAAQTWSSDPSEPPSWSRPSDGQLITKDLRFWELVDVRTSKKHFTEGEDGDGWVEERATKLDEGKGRDGEGHNDSCYGEPGTIRVKSEWRDSNAGGGYLVLNSRLIVEFVTQLPDAVTGCVFIECSTENLPPSPVHISESGRVTTFYRAGEFSSLMRRVAAVSMYGCGLKPAFDLSVNMDKTLLYLAAMSLALAEQITPGLSLGPDPRLLVVMQKGRSAALKTARGIVRGHLVLSLCGTRYVFEPLPKELDSKLSSGFGLPECPARVFPAQFGSRWGQEMFDMLKNNWPALLQRKDTKSPSESSDPRWIGLMLCLCEWYRIRDTAEQLVAGALEWMNMTMVKRSSPIA